MLHFPGLLSCLARLRLTVLLALLTLLGGCSVLQLGYNSAKVPLYWWLNSYLDFTPEQSKRVHADLASLHLWHRQSELPSYALTLQQWQAQVLSPVSADQVCGLWSDFTDSLLRLQRQAEPGVTALVRTLSPEQIDHLSRKFEKRNRQWREEWFDTSPAQRLERRMTQFEERVEILYGALDKTQLALLRSHLTASDFDPSFRLREIERRQQDTLATLKTLTSEKSSDLKTKSELNALLDRMINPTDENYKHQRDRLQTQNCQALAELHNSTSRAQRHRAAEKLESYEVLLQKLVKKGR